MIGMKVRYEMTNVHLKISNVNPREVAEGYVLLTASDENNNEIVFALSHEQSERLEDELFEANRRWKVTTSTLHPKNDESETILNPQSDNISH